MKVAPALIIELKTDRGQILSQKPPKPRAPVLCATISFQIYKTSKNYQILDYKLILVKSFSAWEISKIRN